MPRAACGSAYTPSQTVLAGQRPPSTSAAAGEWRYYGGDSASTKYSPLGQITRANVDQLRIAWRWSSPDNEIAKVNPAARPAGYQDTPIMVNGVLYTTTSLGIYVAIDPATGRTLWQYDPEVWKLGRPPNVGFTHRGTAYWTDYQRRRLIGGAHDATLVSIDAETGKPDLTFGTKGRVDVSEGLPYAQPGRNYAITSTPVVVKNVIIAGSNIQDLPQTKEQPRGDIFGFDARTGKKLWTFHSIPRKGEFGADTWEGDSADYTGGTNVWSMLTVDEELGYVYLPFGTPTNDYYGGHRLGDNLFAESLVCLDATTGRRVWHFQAVHHGLWDYDFPATPVLGEMTVAGRRIKAVRQPSKQAFLYVFDRKTGEPVWPIEERPVPQSTVPGERTSPTQPFPTRPPAFDLQGISDADLIDYTPALKERARTIAKQYVMGPVFTPPSVPSDQPGGQKGTLVQPGAWGSGNWNTGAFDPDTGYYYAISQTLGPANRTARKQAGDPRATMDYADFEPTIGATDQPASQAPPSTVDAISLDGLPIIKGPYGRITAIDLNRGVHVWMKPNGDGPRFHPLLKDLNLPPLGYPNRPAPLLTKTLLFLGEGSDAISGTAGADWTWGRKFRAYDKATGSVIWEMDLPSGTTAGPMTYMINGTQFIVVSVGARDHPPEYVALSLP